ncbi:MAG: hypothetical protein AAFR66_07255 [Bacteroidota bacterium]
MIRFTIAAVLGMIMTFSVQTAQAQNYTTAVGARLGSPISLSAKHFINETSAVEGFVGTRGWATYRWFVVGGAYQYHRPIESVDNLQYYFGAGASVFFWTYDFVFSPEQDFSTTSFGVQGYLGLDYTLEDTPINLTLDWVPTIYVGNGFSTGFAGGFGALGVRYVLK